MIYRESVKYPIGSELGIFADIERECIYFDSLTTGCKLYGSCQCKNCPNYIKN